MEEMIKAFMPITKSVNGTFIGILSDTSLDRDEEFMTKECLADWASDSRPLPMLANHENKMEKFIGGWTNRKTITKGDNVALVAEPFFFSKEANPLAYQVQKMVEEALEKGLQPGISIGAIPKEIIEKECGGKKKKGYNKAEIIEATVVPLQSNRNASFMSIAKSFEFENKPVEVNKMEETVIVKNDVPELQKKYEETIALVEAGKKELAQKELDIIELNKKVSELSCEVAKAKMPTTEQITDVKVEVKELTLAEAYKKVFGGK